MHGMHRPARPSPADFQLWLRRARPGEGLAYHRGLLGHDRAPTGELTASERRAVAGIAAMALAAAKGGSVHLIQRRHGPFDFSYVAIKAAGAGAKAGAPSLAPPPATARPAPTCNPARRSR